MENRTPKTDEQWLAETLQWPHITQMKLSVLDQLAIKTGEQSKVSERLAELEHSRQTVILELGLIALVEGEVFEQAYEEKLGELREITAEQIHLRSDND